jgi:uncharacterized protein YndB with AHSA1/START domain
MTAPRTVRIERALPGPIERVWAYLTEPDKRGAWLAGGPIELKEGGKVRLEFMHTNLTPEPFPERFKQFEHGDTLDGTVVRCEPPRLLSYTWGVRPGSSVVTFELTETGGGVKLVLTHSQLPSRDELLSVSSLWHTHLGLLGDHLRGVRPRPFWSEFAKVEPLYAALLPAE